MNIHELLTAMRAAAPFSTRGRESMSRIAVSRSRVRACDGHASIHVWSSDTSDEDVGFVAHVHPDDIDIIARIVAAKCPKPKRIKKSKSIVVLKKDETALTPEWAFDADGFHLGGELYRLPHGTCAHPGSELPNTDKVVPKKFESLGREDSWTSPTLVGNVCKAFGALGIGSVGRRTTEGNGPDIFVGNGSRFKALSLVMPMRSAHSVDALLIARRDSLTPQPPAKTPEQIAAEKLRAEIEEMQQRLAKMEGAAA